MRTLYRLIALASMLLLSPWTSEISAQVQKESYNDVMLIVNERSSASTIIGSYFALRRGIPDRHICRISADTSETIDSASFIELRRQISAWMASRNLIDSVNYIVTTKGCPLRVSASGDVIDQGQLRSIGGLASFEDCLALMNGSDSSVALAVKGGWPINPYYGSTLHFRRHADSLPMYLVTRLDAYTVEQVRSMIQRAEEPAFLGEGLWVLDLDPGKDGNEGYKVGNDWLRRADTILRARGMNVLRNNDTAYVRDQANVIGYGSWGSNDGHSGGREGAVPHNTWLNGSLAETFVSTGGRTFNMGTTGGQSLIADWIAEGANGVKGYTNEPYLHAIANPDILFDRYTSGFNLAESFWAASILRAWRQVVIGDPKMKLRKMIATSTQVVDFASRMRYAVTRDTIRLINLTPDVVQITALRSAGPAASDFTFQLINGLFPQPIGPNTELPVEVVFRPTAYGARDATLVVEYRPQGGTSTLSALLSAKGEGMLPDLELAELYDFGAVAMGDSATHRIELVNRTASDTVTITRYDKTSGNTSRFRVQPVDTMPTKVYSGKNLELNVTYTPSTLLRDSTTLSLYHDIPGVSRFRMKLFGTGVLAGIADETAPAATVASASPNPFSDRTEVTLVLAHGSYVRAELIDLSGKSVLTVADRSYPAGTHRMMVDGAGLTAGVYLLHVSATDAAGHPIARAVSLVKR